MFGISEGLRTASIRRVSGLAGVPLLEGGRYVTLRVQEAAFLVTPFRETCPSHFAGAYSNGQRERCSRLPSGEYSSSPTHRQ